MAEWRSIGTPEMLVDGRMTELEVGGQTVLLARIAGVYYAVQGRCPHLGGHLARGRLDGNIVTCPRHGSQFDLTTGKVVAWVEGLPGLVKDVAQALSRAKALVTYETRVDENQVWVRL